MSDAEVLEVLHQQYMESMLSLHTIPEATVLGGGSFTLLLATFFFVIVWVGVPIIENTINFLYKCVDKLHDILH